MSEFTIKKHLSLKFLGEGWEEAYINFTPVSMDEIMSFTSLTSKLTQTNNNDEAMTKAGEVYEYAKGLLKKHFLNGLGYSEDSKDDTGKLLLKPISIEAATGELFTEIYAPFMQSAQGLAVDQNL